MKNFGQGMWRRVSDYDKHNSENNNNAGLLQYYLGLLAYMRQQKPEEPINKQVVDDDKFEIIEPIVEIKEEQNVLVEEQVEEPLVNKEEILLVEEEILLVEEEESIIKEEILLVDEPIIEEEILLEEPVVEEPIIKEESVVEEPIIEEEILLVEEPIIEEEILVEEILVEEPVVEELVKSAKKKGKKNKK